MLLRCYWRLVLSDVLFLAKAEISIEQADQSDLAQIVNLLKVNNLPYSDISFCINEMIVMVKMSNTSNTIIGVAAIEDYSPYGLLRSVSIFESFKGRGYGRLLLQEMIKQAKQKEIRELYLFTTSAQEFFQRFGFTQVDRLLLPPTIQNTSEFRYLCSATATSMKLSIK